LGPRVVRIRKVNPLTVRGGGRVLPKRETQRGGRFLLIAGREEGSVMATELTRKVCSFVGEGGSLQERGHLSVS